MGYDMHIANPDPAVEAAVAALQPAVDEAVAARNALRSDDPGYAAAQAAVHAAYDAIDAARVDYFRLNIHGMGSMRDTMHNLGMLAGTYEQPRFPELSDHGLTQEEWWAMDEDSADPRAVAMRAANDAVLVWSPPDEPGLPVHKFGSNDGWHVTVRDCTSALALFDRAAAERPDAVAAARAEWTFSGASTSYFDAWIAFLRRGADPARNGFRVY